MSLPLTFDVVLAVHFPLLLLLLAYRLSQPLTWPEIRALLSLSPSSRPPHFSLERAYSAYAQYTALSARERSAMQRSYAALPRAHKRLGYAIHYPEKLARLKHVTDLNAFVADGIAELTGEEFPRLAGTPKVEGSSADLGRVREAMKHFVRDWSTEGEEERGRIFKPILELLGRVEKEERKGMKVLVPGCGLGRLAWEVSELGFDTTANEFSYFMTLAFRFLLSPSSTTSENQHTLRPYAHWFSHQRSTTSLFRSITFPDVLPRLSPTLHLVEQDFLTLPVPPNTPSPDTPAREPGYAYIITLFFIDTSLNAFATLEHIYHLLRPGGTWINLGPLLWTGGAQAKVELSLEEVLRAAEEIGFVVLPGGGAEGGEGDKSRTVECEYTGDREAMMRWVYKAEFWVARKMK